MDKTSDMEESKKTSVDMPEEFEAFSEPFDNKLEAYEIEQEGKQHGASSSESSLDFSQLEVETVKVDPQLPAPAPAHKSESLKFVVHPSIVGDLKVIQLKEILKEYK